MINLYAEYDPVAMATVRSIAIDKGIDSITKLIISETVPAYHAKHRLDWFEYWLRTAPDNEILQYINETSNN
jgi:hypothetical protein